MTSPHRTLGARALLLLAIGTATALAVQAACSTGDDDAQPDTNPACTNDECFISCLASGMPSGHCDGDLCICDPSAADADADGDVDVPPDTDTTEVTEDGRDDAGEDGPVDVDSETEWPRDDGETTEDAPPDIPDVEAYDSGRACLDVAVGWSFNGGPGSWTHAAIDAPPSGSWDPWEHGTPTGGPGACRGTGTTNRCWTTGLAGGYPTCQRAVLVSPLLDLSPCAASPLRTDITFWHWFAFGSGSGSTDGGTVEISSDGGSTWVALEPLAPGWRGTVDMNLGSCSGAMYLDGREGFVGTSGGAWVMDTLRIPAEHRTASFQFRFVFGSDDASGGQGWFIDDAALVVR